MKLSKSNTVIAALALSLTGVSMLTACTPASQVASENLSKAADNFEVQRRIVFFNAITDKYIMTVEGRCSISPDPGSKKLDVTCKVGDNQFKKDFFGLSDNTAYFAEQLDPINVNTYNTRVIYRPETILPAAELDVSKK